MHRAMHALAATVVVVVGAPAHAASHIVDIAWGTDGRFTHSAGVEPGGFVEVCGKLSVDDVVRWSFDASRPVDFNIHYHVGKEAEFPAKLPQIATARDTLRVAVSEDYCWMWTNRSPSTAKVDVLLQR